MQFQRCRHWRRRTSELVGVRLDDPVERRHGVVAERVERVDNGAERLLLPGWQGVMAVGVGQRLERLEELQVERDAGPDLHGLRVVRVVRLGPLAVQPRLRARRHARSGLQRVRLWGGAGGGRGLCRRRSWPDGRVLGLLNAGSGGDGTGSGGRTVVGGFGLHGLGHGTRIGTDGREVFRLAGRLCGLGGDRFLRLFRQHHGFAIFHCCRERKKTEIPINLPR